MLLSILAKRNFSHAKASQSLTQRLSEIIPKHREEVKKVKTELGSKILGSVTVDQAYGGMRDVNGLIYETSLLDAQEGIRFRGYSIPELQKLLPKLRKDDGEPLPEGVLWLLLTGEVPTKEQVSHLSSELTSRAAEHKLPEGLVNLLTKGVSQSLHPMSQLTMAIMYLQDRSIFAKEYSKGSLKKDRMWEPALEDTLNLIALLPEIASLIYRTRYERVAATGVSAIETSDWSGKFAAGMGFTDPKFYDLLRLYLSIHTDHEGGNASAHTTKLVGSTLADPYLSYAAGLNALAGPLHGLANQEVLNWMLAMKANIGEHPTEEQITEYAWKELKSGRVIPGYGHAVLRKTDPRYIAQREFAMKHLPNDPLFKITDKLFKVIPQVLTEQGKVKNPWPNVDAHSGVLLQHFGLVQQDFYTVLFGVSRAIGALSGLVWDRALGFPIERPKSFTTESIKEMFKNK